MKKTPDNPVRRSVKALIGGAEVRQAEFEGVPHIVVPVIALKGNLVLRPSNSAGPEFVPESELQAAPATWNGRPVVAGHPTNATGSANDVDTLQSIAFGQIFNTLYEDGSLKTEAWLSREKSTKLGGEALDMFNRAEAGEDTEVSVGVLVKLEQRNGTSPSGESFEFVWHDLIPDHLAFLPPNSTGACSIQDGCGAPRLNTRVEPLYMRAAVKQGTWRRIFKSEMDIRLEAFRAAAHDPSDSDIRFALWSELVAVEPSFLWIEEIRQQSGTVFYSVDPRGEFQTFMRQFTVVENGDEPVEVDLGADRTLVEQTITVEFRPLDSNDSTNQQGDTEMKTECKCKEKVTALIAHDNSSFAKADREHLESLDESRIDAFLSQCKSVTSGQPVGGIVAGSDPTLTSDTSGDQPSDTVTVSRTDFEAMKASITEMAPAADAHKARLEAERNSLAENVFKSQGDNPETTLEQLQGKSIEDLRFIASLTGAKAVTATPAADFSGARTGKNGANTTKAPVPVSMTQRFAELKEARSNG